VNDVLKSFAAIQDIVNALLLTPILVTKPKNTYTETVANTEF
jgi:hypothetical protein